MHAILLHGGSVALTPKASNLPTTVSSILVMPKTHACNKSLPNDAYWPTANGTYPEAAACTSNALPNRPACESLMCVLRARMHVMVGGARACAHVMLLIEAGGGDACMPACRPA